MGNVPMAPTWAEVNLTALRKNLHLLRSMSAPMDLMAIVKADAYGHGALPVSRVLEEEGVRFFGVATVPEGVALREGGIRGRILVLGNLLPDQAALYPKYDLEATVGSMEVVDFLVRHPVPLRVHVKVDTGMGRIGLAPGEVLKALDRLEAAQKVQIEALWTHLATADEAGSPFVREQVERFLQVLREVNRTFPLVHVANTGAVIDYPEIRRFFDRALARVGISLYGYPPSREVGGTLSLKPILRCCTRITQVKWVRAGTTVSYGRTWAAPRDTRIATLSAGYADGYLRSLSNRGKVRIGERLYPVVGRVCMDMTMVDLGPEGPPVREGGVAVLFGPEGPTAMEVAEWAGTISYEILCALAPRVARVYVETPL